MEDPIFVPELLYEQESVFKKVYGWYWPTSEKECYESEKRLLSFSNAQIKSKFVKANGHNIHTLEMGSHFQDPQKAHLNKTMVMAPGFGAGAALFYKNFEAFGNHPGLKTYAIDWLGTGRSSRVPFKWKPGKEGSIQGAEDFFIDSLEAWREEQKIDKFILFGHSLGGYLSACYALKYPERVEHLMLVSPAGVPTAPVLTAEERQLQARSRPFIFSVVTFFWDLNVTPQGFIRFLGHFGPNLVRAYSDRRFPTITGEESAALRDYGYHISARAGSGEYALNVILSTGAWARNPLINRLHAIKSPTTFVYGKHDWMDSNAGRAASLTIDAPTSVEIVRKSGHHLYLENPDEFNKVILDVVKDLQK